MEVPSFTKRNKRNINGEFTFVDEGKKSDAQSPFPRTNELKTPPHVNSDDIESNGNTAKRKKNDTNKISSKSEVYTPKLKPVALFKHSTITQSTSRNPFGNIISDDKILSPKEKIIGEPPISKQFGDDYFNINEPVSVESYLLNMPTTPIRSGNKITIEQILESPASKIPNDSEDDESFNFDGTIDSDGFSSKHDLSNTINPGDDFFNNSSDEEIEESSKNNIGKVSKELPKVDEEVKDKDLNDDETIGTRISFNYSSELSNTSIVSLGNTPVTQKLSRYTANSMNNRLFTSPRHGAVNSVSPLNRAINLITITKAKQMSKLSFGAYKASIKAEFSKSTTQLNIDESLWVMNVIIKDTENKKIECEVHDSLISDCLGMTAKEGFILMHSRSNERRTQGNKKIALMMERLKLTNLVFELDMYASENIKPIIRKIRTLDEINHSAYQT
uniref:RMI1_C domain-containing protein n=1 Tax=Rhabditophanes sp. KR3021 TaxID=114890 RepID=A0AC35UGT7_9BILA